jgi:hypothetical protein
MSEGAPAFPVRFRGYDRDAVDWELRELRTALDFAQAERDRAVARALAVENPERTGAPTSATVQWLIQTAEEDARRIRDEAMHAAAEYTERADELLRHRVELIEAAQREADVCRAQAAEEARDLVREALEKSETLLHGLQEGEAALRRMFESGVLIHHMPPPRSPADERKPTAPAGADTGMAMPVQTAKHTPVPRPAEVGGRHATMMDPSPSPPHNPAPQQTSDSAS